MTDTPTPSPKPLSLEELAAVRSLAYIEAGDVNRYWQRLLDTIADLQAQIARMNPPAGDVRERVTVKNDTSAQIEKILRRHAYLSWGTVCIHENNISAAAQSIARALPQLASGGMRTPAERDVIAERRRQVTEEDWSPEHDDTEHTLGQLAAAASCYALSACGKGEYLNDVRKLGGVLSPGPLIRRPRPYNWPWPTSWWKPKDARRDLVRAGALILAEIERLDRAAQQEGGT